MQAGIAVDQRVSPPSAPHDDDDELDASHDALLSFDASMRDSDHRFMEPCCQDAWPDAHAPTVSGHGDGYDDETWWIRELREERNNELRGPSSKANSSMQIRVMDE